MKVDKLKARTRTKTTHSVLGFVQHTFPRYAADPAHELIASYLDAAVSGEITRLMIFAPPQHGKSELVSVRLPAYWLGRRPYDPVIIASYAATLAHSKSRQARNVVEAAEFGQLFPNVKTDPTARARNEWSLVPPLRGGVVAAGVGGPITGHGAMLGVIDDPIENWEQAQSLTFRERTWEWWKGTYRTRIWENGVIVLIMTRWHEDDLAGRLLMEQGDRWTVVRLPAIAETQDERDFRDGKMFMPVGSPDPLGREPGEPLCPSRFSIETLHEIRQDVGSTVWNAEYQGAPTAPEGNRFKRAWFTIVDAVPREARRGRYWDFAATAGAGARTAGVLLAIHEGTVYVEDVVFGQWSTGERNAIMRQTAEMDKTSYGHIQTWFEEEGGSSGKDASLAIVKLMMGLPVAADRPTGNKDVRLEPFAAQAEAGRVRLLRGAWNGAYIDEMCSVPNGTFRDMADGTAGAFNKLNPIGRGVSQTEQRKLKQPSRWTQTKGPRWTRR